MTVEKNPEFVAAYTATDNIEAQLFAQALIAANIDAHVVEDLSQTGAYLFGGYISNLHRPRIWVRVEDLPRATELLQRLEQQRKHRRTIDRLTPDDDATVLIETCEDCGRPTAFSGAQRGTVQQCSHCHGFIDVGPSSSSEEKVESGASAEDEYQAPETLEHRPRLNVVPVDSGLAPTGRIIYLVMVGSFVAIGALFPMLFGGPWIPWENPWKLVGVYASLVVLMFAWTGNQGLLLALTGVLSLTMFGHLFLIIGEASIASRGAIYHGLVAATCLTALYALLCSNSLHAFLQRSAESGTQSTITTEKELDINISDRAAQLARRKIAACRNPTNTALRLVESTDRPQRFEIKLDIDDADNHDTVVESNHVRLLIDRALLPTIGRLKIDAVDDEFVVL